MRKCYFRSNISQSSVINTCEKINGWMTVYVAVCRDGRMDR